MKTILARYTRKDFRIETFAAGGPGGQHQNKTQSGVRITHKATGLCGESRAHRSQGQNKRAALKALAAKLLEHHRSLAPVMNQISTEVIRTYHAVENRVKDHASGLVQPYLLVLNDGAPMIEARAKSRKV